MLLDRLNKVFFLVTSFSDECLAAVEATKVVTAEVDGRVIHVEVEGATRPASVFVSFPQKKWRTMTPSGQNSGTVILDKSHFRIHRRKLLNRL